MSDFVCKNPCQPNFCKRCKITENNGFDFLNINNQCDSGMQRTINNSHKRKSLSKTKKDFFSQVAFSFSFVSLVAYPTTGEKSIFYPPTD